MDGIPQRDPQTESIYINKEFCEFGDLSDGKDLFRYTAAAKKHNRLNALLIDGIQVHPPSLARYPRFGCLPYPSVIGLSEAWLSVRLD